MTTGGEGASGGAKMLIRTGLVSCCALCLSITMHANAGHPLFDVVRQGDTVALRTLLLQQSVDVNARDADGTAALHWASFIDDAEIAALLVDAGADVNAADDYGVTPLMLACENRSAAMVKVFLQGGANPNATRSTGETPLMTCSRTGSVEAVSALLGYGAETSAKGEWHSQTALMWAVSQGHSDVARVLIEHGADINARSAVRIRQKEAYNTVGNYTGLEDEKHGGFTPLLFAARSGDLASVQLLLAAGAKVNETAEDGSSPLLVATVRGHLALAEFLLDHGADPNAAEAGYVPLHWVAGLWDTDLTAPGNELGRDDEWAWLRGRAAGKLQFVRNLLAHGADPNARILQPPPNFGHSGGASDFRRYFTGATPFLMATQANDIELMRVLLSSGADPHLATLGRSTPLMMAAGLGRHNERIALEDTQLEAVSLLLDLGMDVNAANADGETALHAAAFTGSDAVIELLVNSGAMVNPIDKNGATPLQHATAKGYVKGYERTADLLRSLGGLADRDCVHVNAYDTVCSGSKESVEKESPPR